jgi:flagellar P-ring protein precursor FlgI
LVVAHLPERAAHLTDDENTPMPIDRTERALRIAITCTVFLASAALWWPAQAAAARIKEVAAVQGVRSNQLVGYGLVVGLDGSGDQTTQTPFTVQSLNAMLQQMGVTVPPGTSMQLKNVAAVMVTASLPAFAQPGQAIDVNVSSVGNAKSLRGGTLIGTPLKGADGQVYAMAQGNLIVGGAGASAGGSKVQINHLSAGRIPEGATVERAVLTPLNQGEFIQLDLQSGDFATARDVAKTINQSKGAGTAYAIDGRVVRVRMPPEADARVSFLADIENLPLDLAKPAAKVVLNARTGSVVMNDAVTLAACAVAHGSLSVTISSTPVISQPGALSAGETVVAQKSDISISQQGGALVQMPAGTKLADVVKALNALGATPQDLLAILQAMKSAGALNAELEVI